MTEYITKLMPGLMTAAAYFFGIVCGVYWTSKKENK